MIGFIIYEKSHSSERIILVLLGLLIISFAFLITKGGFELSLNRFLIIYGLIYILNNLTEVTANNFFAELYKGKTMILNSGFIIMSVETLGQTTGTAVLSIVGDSLLSSWNQFIGIIIFIVTVIFLLFGLNYKKY